MSNRIPIIMVSSTVYGIDQTLELIYSRLSQYGFEVWMSYAGTVHVDSRKTAFDNCLEAVRKCDLFLGIITKDYGSGIDKMTGLSITHREMKLAMELGKPRWMLVHESVPAMRAWLDALGYSGREGRIEFLRRIVNKPYQSAGKLFDAGKRLFDLRSIDMYEDAILNEEPLDDRQGNWVQPYKTPYEANRFVTAQFARYQEVLAFAEENFRDVAPLFGE